MPRSKISVTVDPNLLKVIDNFVREHEELDRSKVIEQALELWTAARQDAAMEAQFAGQEKPAAERRAWRSIRRAAASSRVAKP